MHLNEKWMFQYFTHLPVTDTDEERNKRFELVDGLTYGERLNCSVPCAALG
jgi:hypothetical protein